MNADTLKVIFQAKNLRRKELAAMPIGDKMRLIEALHRAGTHLRKVRPQIGSVGLGMKVRQLQSSRFEKVGETETQNLRPSIGENNKVICLPQSEVPAAA